MYPYIHIFGRNINSYGVLALIGMGAVVLYSFFIARKYEKEKDFYNRFIYIIFCFVASVMVAAVVYQLACIRFWIIALPYLFTDFETFKSYMSFGIVFYGGMFGIFVGMLIYTKLFKEDTREWCRTTVPAIPLFHVFGRIGCTIGGCCYGTPKIHGISEFDEAMSYFPIGTNSIFHDHYVYNAKIGMYCIPIQLIESFGCLIIFIILLVNQIFQKDKKKYYRPIGIYFILYGILRFVLEFWRGDLIRGIYGPFSTSQYISMIVVPLGIYMLLCPVEKNFLNKWYTPGKKKKKKEAITV